MGNRTSMNSAINLQVTPEADTQTPLKRRRVQPAGIIAQTIRVKSGDELVNYSYMLINRATQQAVVIDPAWELGKFQAVLNARKCSLSGILLTHHHKDHTNLANELAADTDAPVFMSSTEIDCYSFKCRNLRPVTGNRIDCAGMQIDVIDTPGHTAGSVCYAVDGNLFTGDTLFIEGCGVCKGWGASADQLYESLTLLCNSFPDSTKVFPGHRFRQPPGKSLEYVKENNLYLQTRDKREFINVHMRERDVSAIEYL